MSYGLEVFNIISRPVLLMMQDLQEDVPKHWHPEIEISLSIEFEKGQFVVGNKISSVSAGDIHYINPYEIHGVNINEKTQDKNTSLTLVIPIDFVDRYCPIINFYQINVGKIDSSTKTQGGKEIYQTMSQLFQELMALYNQEINPLNDFQITLKVLRILELYLLYFSEEKEVNALADSRMQEIIDYLQKNYQEKITLDELAAKFLLTKSYLSRYFKNSTGMSIMQYLEIIRIHHAVEELKNTSNSIENIAMQCGFSNSKSMNKVLKEIYGTTAKSFKSHYLP